jgi:hypothetical protein
MSASAAASARASGSSSWCSGRRRALGKLLFAAWTIGPPAWFLIRYRFWPPAPGQLESFRIEQGLARSVWAGVLVLMAVVFFGHW